MQSRNFRSERKFFINNTQLELLKRRIMPIMHLDEHTGGKGYYNVRSLYFDDFHNSCFYEKEDGTDPREKYRIRVYDGSAEYISFECKRKERGKTLKKSCIISEDQAKSLIGGCSNTITEDQAPLLRRFAILMRTAGFHPVCIVNYDRIPYTFTAGNVRVTIDTHISASSDVDAFWEGIPACRPVMPTGMHLMEVKYDDFIPDLIARSLDLGQLQETACSKYYLCRKYSFMRGGR